MPAVVFMPMAHVPFHSGVSAPRAPPHALPGGSSTTSNAPDDEAADAGNIVILMPNEGSLGQRHVPVRLQKERSSVRQPRLNNMDHTTARGAVSALRV